MNIEIHGKSAQLTEAFKSRVENRMARMERFGVLIEMVDVEVNVEQNPRHGDSAHKIQLTSRGVGPRIRSEAAGSDNFSAFDIAAEKFELQLRKAHERNKAVNRVSLKELPIKVDPADEQNEAPIDAYQIVREKSHHAEIMSKHDAIDAMELLDHDFYLFIESESGKPAVIYRRRGYSYGLIKMENGTA
jgi:ribosomal subunit interface protein